jgi:hypothetical protein
MTSWRRLAAACGRYRSGGIVITDQLLSEIEAGQGEPLTRAAKRVPSARNGRPATLSRLFRWVMQGVLGPDGQRVYLEAARLAGTWITTPGAIRRFVAAQTPCLNAEQSPTPRAPAARQRAAERAGKALEQIGI